AGFDCASLEIIDKNGQITRFPHETLVQAVSGRTGKLIWSHRLDGLNFQRPFESGPEIVPFSITPGRWRDKPVLTVFAIDRLITLDRNTGQPVADPVKLPQRIRGNADGLELPCFFDPAGTGELAMLLIQDIDRENPNDYRASQVALKIAAISAVTGTVLWEVL